MRSLRGLSWWPAMLSIILVLSACSTASTTPDEGAASPSRTQPPRELSVAGDATNTCTDALDDSVQAAFDLSEVTVTTDASHLYAAYSWEGEGYDHSANVEFRLSLRPIGTDEGYVMLTTFIGGGTNLEVTSWESENGDAPISPDQYVYTDSRPMHRWSTGYPIDRVAHLGNQFEWSATAIYNQNGSDDCGNLPWAGRWYAFQP